MKPDPARTSAPRREEGVALVVVLLFTAIVLSIVVSTTATLAIGARGGGVNERAAYQALLAAESGLNTFAVRYAAKQASLTPDQRLRGTVTADRFNAWLEQAYARDLASYTTGSGLTTTLSFDAGAGSGALTLVATGSPGTARKVVLQNFQAEYVPGFNIHADAPLLSYPNVDVTNNASVIGENWQNSDGTVTVARVSTPTPVTLAAATQPQATTLTLTSTFQSGKLLLGAGDYTQINGITYKVTGMQGNQATLTSLIANASPLVIANDTAVKRIDSAVTAAFSQQINTTSTVRVSDPSFFVKGSTIALGNMLGRVEATDDNLKTVSVLWQQKVPETAPSVSEIPEGTPIRRNVQGVISGYSVDGSSTNIGNGFTADDTRVRNLNPFNPAADTADNDLFTYTFGQTKAQMLGPSGWVPVTPASAFTGAVNGGITLVDGTTSLSGNQELCGNGILIVRGHLTVNGTCAAGFRGAIYVMGDYDQQGNSTITGAVIAEGATEITRGTECVAIPPSDDNPGGNVCDTKIAGTGQGSGKITYDRAALLEAGSILTPPTFTAVQGTWRQR